MALTEEEKAYHKKYYQENRERILQRKRKYYLDNREEILQKDKERDIKDPERGKKHYQKYKEKMIKNSADWYKAHPEKRKLKRIKAEAKYKGWGNPEPINDWFEGAHFHHLHVDGNHRIGIYIPAELHMSVSHSYNDEESMNKINNLAIKWYGD